MNEKGMVLPSDGLKRVVGEQIECGQHIHMNAIDGGFAAALKNWKLLVMNVVPNDFSVTLPISYERGLSGIYHNLCESFSTDHRSHYLLHADSLFSKLKKRCNIVAVIVEGGRILRPERYLLIENKGQC